MKIIDSLRTENGILTTQKDIIKEQYNFMKESFRKKVIFDENKAEQFINNLHVPQLSQEQSEQLEQDLSEQEVLAALKTMRNNSAPGFSGLTTSFLKFFWSKIKEMLVNSLKDAYTNGEMSTSQKKAVITLIHKGKDLPKDKLKNYRPISLLKTDYRIHAKCLALRLSKVIANLINEDQVGFIKGRKSSTVIRLIDDIIEYMNDENKPGILLALDYSRAFDSISKEFIIWSFKKFGFGEAFVNWVKVITKNTESCINGNGWISESFNVETGIRQGCPFSPMTFVLALEILAIKIRADDSIGGIELPKFTRDANEVSHFIKLAMYADDIAMFFKDQIGLENAIKTVNIFSEVSQLKMNTNKTGESF